MVIVKLMGGLGNQMFQYAVGRNLSIKNRTKLKLDLSFLNSTTESDNFTKREYELDKLNVEGLLADKADLKYFLSKENNLVTKLLNNKKIVIEGGFGYDPTILKMRGNIYLEGYWQTEKYFHEIRDVIIREFKPVKNLSKSADNYNNILSGLEKTVSVHIRRGDYVSKSSVTKFHGCLKNDYYDKAFSLIEKNLNNPTYIFFSDDIDWCKKHFSKKNAIFISGNEPIEDIYLMSVCGHNIIANSSFSWWGAWLNSNSDKIVIAPSKWFNDTSINTTDLLPHDWLRI